MHPDPIVTHLTHAAVPARVSHRGTLACVAVTMLQIQLAGLSGALFDQMDHAGISAWRSMCRSGALTWHAAISIQLTLLPAMATAMVAMAGLQLAVAAARNAPARFALTAACHLSCLVVMIAGAALCARLFALSGSDIGGMASMLAAELLAGAALASGISCLAPRLLPFAFPSRRPAALVSAAPSGGAG